MPATKPPHEELRTVMRSKKLTNVEVADLAGVSVKTVESWLASEDAASRREMPERQMRAIRALLPGYLAKRKKA